MVDTVVVNSGLETVWNNAGVITGLVAAILGTIYNFINSHFKHNRHTDQIAKIVSYINEVHGAITNNHDKFVGLVQAATDLSPELKKQLEANGADVNKVVADSETTKVALQKILDEVNALTVVDQARKSPKAA